MVSEHAVRYIGGDGARAPTEDRQAASRLAGVEDSPLTDRTPAHTGGCQCGAVRYALYAETLNPYLCHCRMCQKAVGNYFAAYGSVVLGDFAWTRGKPGLWKSSVEAERGFCCECGTPLSFRYVARDRIAVALGTLDDPTRVAPKRSFGAEASVPFFAELPALPSSTTEGDFAKTGSALPCSRQHPDHDTGQWPLER